MSGDIERQRQNTIDLYIKKTTEISALTRMMSFGLVGLCYTLLTSDSELSNEMVAERKTILFFSGGLGLLAILLDYFNVALLVRATLEAMDNSVGGYEYRSKSWSYRCAILFFHGKQIVVAIATLLLLATIVFELI